ncbi:membrane protein [Streptomyces pseudoechinosporeus]
MMSESSSGFRARDGFALAGVVIALGAVIVVALGTWKWFVRETAPVVLDWPGGSWSFGAVSGLIVVFGSLGAWWFSARNPGESRPQRAGRVAGIAVCGGGAFAMVMYIFASLPGRNCSSYDDGCEYIPGTGSALIACLATAMLVGWAAYRVGSARAEERQARERERMRKLRKKGKGKSREARQR